MEVICLEDSALYALIEEVVNRLKEQHGIRREKWISGPEAMKMLRISSKTTLAKLRDMGHLKFSQPEKKIILYDSDSILAFLEKHTKTPFGYER